MKTFSHCQKHQELLYPKINLTNFHKNDRCVPSSPNTVFLLTPYNALERLQKPRTHEKADWQGEDLLQSHPLQLQKSTLACGFINIRCMHYLPPSTGSSWGRRSIVWGLRFICRYNCCRSTLRFNRYSCRVTPCRRTNETPILFSIGAVRIRYGSLEVALATPQSNLKPIVTWAATVGTSLRCIVAWNNLPINPRTSSSIDGSSLSIEVARIRRHHPELLNVNELVIRCGGRYPSRDFTIPSRGITDVGVDAHQVNASALECHREHVVAVRCISADSSRSDLDTR